MDITTFAALPGAGAEVDSQESAIWAGRETSQNYAGLFLDSTTVDAGNTPTTALRPGLVLGRIESTGLYKQYSPTATDGTQIARAVLRDGVSTLDQTGVAIVTNPMCLIRGIWQAPNLIGLDYIARRQLLIAGITLSDDIDAREAFLGPSRCEVAKTANYTVVASDAGKKFTTTGAAGEVDFTLPAVATSAGLSFEFLNVVDQVMKVISAEGTNIIWDGLTQFTSLAFSTASHKCGGHLILEANVAGTAWHVRQCGASTCTVTAA